MARYKIHIEYEGTNLAGWQKQKNGISVQEILENSLFKLTGEKKIIQIIKNKKIVLSFKEYEKQRILNCVPDIEKDNLYNKAYLLQYNFENLNSICWKKGCFVGQEVTIKMKKRGSLKKKLYIVKSLTKNLNSPKEIKYKDQLIGTTTSHYKNIALALIYIDKIKKIKKEKNVLII